MIMHRCSKVEIIIIGTIIIIKINSDDNHDTNNNDNK